MNIKSCFLRWGIPLLLLAAFLAAVFALNRVDKVALVNREGQTFEKGVSWTFSRTTSCPTAPGWANSGYWYA